MTEEKQTPAMGEDNDTVEMAAVENKNDEPKEGDSGKI